jgi:hypothetical protein
MNRHKLLDPRERQGSVNRRYVLYKISVHWWRCAVDAPLSARKTAVVLVYVAGRLHSPYRLEIKASHLQMVDISRREWWRGLRELACRGLVRVHHDGKRIAAVDIVDGDRSSPAKAIRGTASHGLCRACMPEEGKAMRLDDVALTEDQI